MWKFESFNKLCTESKEKKLPVLMVVIEDIYDQKSTLLATEILK